ncbi:rubredoxin [Candidatus Contubernalis alkaliaceticus]|uniref:rubredoxin n=1 Tax=Candidatus Contubernalis alkaliaceticus TaxID=338645 RepID=UPI001F4C0F12|nr:rubredoxin [Candidatus Contubernalis alkalaceticus]UNC91925.1 rubredoxin [Candidatus Contubernalis alkalaceticus]
MQKYICMVCSYIYDPEIADPDRGVDPITIFDDLPEEWCCPICGAEHFDFQEL